MVLMLLTSKVFQVQPFTHASEDVLSKLLLLSLALLHFFSLRLLNL